MTNTPTDTILF